MNLLHRRTFLVGLASTMGCAGLKVSKDAIFPLGVAAGDALPDGALLWTHYTGSEALDAVVWPESGQGFGSPTGPSDPTDAGAPGGSMETRRMPAPDAEGFALADFSGLTPGTWYLFRFEGSGGAVSPVGRFRTAIAPGALETVTIAATSCIKNGHSYSALGHAAGRTDLDAFIFLGDAVYTDGASILADFRLKWATGLGQPEYMALRASTSMIPLWDDHEVRDNWEGGSVNPALLDAARRAFLEHQPLRQNRDRPLRYWRTIKWGNTAELFVLDGRSERIREQGQYLSPEQLDWLLNGVAQSTATFKLILNTVPIGDFHSALFAPFINDCWLSYPEQRAQLLNGLEASGAERVIIVSGDFHFACFGRAGKSGEPGNKVYEALVGPGAHDPNPSPTYPHGDPWEFSSAVSNYTTFELNPQTKEAHVRYHAGDGRILFERVLT